MHDRPVERSAARKLGAPLLFALAAWVALAAGCIDPKEPRPGFHLSGEVVRGAVDDWAFTAGVQKVFVETKTWYLIPHSIEANVASYGGALYVPSIYYQGGRFPEGRSWNRNIVRDPRVRVQIGDKIYPRRAALVTGPAEIQGVFEAFAAKYPIWRDLLARAESERPPVYFIRMDGETRP